MNALNGLSAIAFELVHAGKAEELFRRSLVIRQTDEAARGLAEAERMRNPERWTGYEKRRRKSWGHWRETQFPELTHEQRLKRMVEIVARRQ